MEELSAMNASSPNLSDCCADNLHFINGEAIAAHDIAFSASGLNIAFNVRNGVVDPIETAINRGCSAIYAWLSNQIRDFSSCKIAVVDPLVSLSKEDGAAFIGSSVLEVPCLSRKPLLGRHIYPSFLAAIAALASRAMTRLAFISDPKWSGRIGVEKLFSCRQFCHAPVAFSHVGTVSSPHRKRKP